MGENFVCPLCGNRDPGKIGQFLGVPYCQKCFAIEKGMIKRTAYKGTPSALELSYRLSDEQQELSDRIINNFEKGKDTLLYAVCGSGKTEVSYGVIDLAMQKKMHVGFALPRRDVVIELYDRMIKAFPSKKIVAVYGGHVGETEGDLIVLTTHQLFRYKDYFDLLVMDEVDAFPYAGNAELERHFKESLRGHCVLMSATPSKALVSEFSQMGHEILMMHTRFHKKPIPVPVLVILHGVGKYRFIMKKLSEYQRTGKTCFIFVPSIDLAQSLFRTLSRVFPKGNYVSSKREQREEIIQDFKEGKYLYLVTTAILERGITVKNLNIIVFGAASRIYDAACLTQIAGRAGRKADAPQGDVYFLADRETEAIKKAISEIEYCNTYLSNLSKKHS